jgi:hypothetical protein
LDHGRNLQLMCNMFNVANHQNVDGFVTTSEYYFSGTTAAFQGKGTTNGFAVPSSSNNSGFLYTPRQIEFAARINF